MFLHIPDSDLRSSIKKGVDTTQHLWEGNERLHFMTLNMKLLEQVTI